MGNEGRLQPTGGQETGTKISARPRGLGRLDGVNAPSLSWPSFLPATGRAAPPFTRSSSAPSPATSIHKVRHFPSLPFPACETEHPSQLCSDLTRLQMHLMVLTNFDFSPKDISQQDPGCARRDGWKWLDCSVGFSSCSWFGARLGRGQPRGC